MRLLRLAILLVAVAIVVFPAGMVLAYPPPNPVRDLPATVERGEAFNVTVSFTAPIANFTSVLTEVIPDSWNVSVLWCNPSATVKTTNNMTEYMWLDPPYANGTNFTVLYRVTVPCNTSEGYYNFTGMLYYGSNNTPVAGEPVEVKKPTICFTPASIDFYAAVGQNPANQTLQLWSSTPCMIDWSLSDDADYEGHDWLSENSTSGNCTNVTSSVAVSVNTSDMPVGDYSANITINATGENGANNSPQNVTVNLYIRTAGTLRGHVNFLGRGGPGTDRWVEPFVVKFFDNATKLEVGWSPLNITTDAYGNFTIEDIEIGTYDIGIKNQTCLSELNRSVTFTPGNASWVNFSTIREGDVKENDKVDGFDFSLLSGAYDTKPGDAKWNANADLNRSGKVDGFDFSLLSGNYNARGAAYGYF